MRKILYKCTTTTHAIRKKLKSTRDINSIVKKFNIDRTATKKWKNRDNIKYKPMGSSKSNSNLTLDKDWLICEVRKLT